MTDEQLELARRFALALDDEDYDAARALLDDACEYTIRVDAHHGADSIIASYRAAGEAARAFDEVAYDSEVREGPDGWTIIRFSDDLRHAGRSHRYQCEQWVRIAGARITRIDHRELPGERERLEAFKRDVLG
jgi:hypothetical protein